jgi:hypothetical protein
MKKRLSILSCLLGTLMLVSVMSPPRSQSVSTNWLDEVTTCGDTYLDRRWGVGMYDDARYRCEDPHLDFNGRLDCIWDQDSAYHACLSSVYGPSPAEPDYCTGARVAAAICANQFQDVDDFGPLMECRAKSGIDYCQ